MIVYSLQLDENITKTFVMPPVGSKHRAGDIEDFDTGVKKTDTWVTPGIKWFDEDGRNLDKHKDPDISYISHAGSLIISPRTHDLIAPLVNDVAELLPVSFDNETWYLLNVFNQVTALDKANSQYKIYSSGKVGWLTKAAFLADKVPHNKLFKIPENPARIYFAEHHQDNDENSIKNIIEKNNLFGIKFVKVFES